MASSGGIVHLALAGDGEDARERFDALWHTLPASDAFYGCVVAHYVADVQPDAHEALKWFMPSP
jgi:hypothetical protein